MRLPVGYFRTIYDPRFSWQFPLEPRAGHRQPRRSPGRAARRSAARASSTACSTSAASMPTSTTGPACTARAAGATASCCRSSSAPKRYEGGESEYHGASGELGVSDLRNDHPYCEAWLAAGAEAGHPLTDDFNGAVSDGLGRYQLTLRGRWRCDAATAFLAPARQRPNLTVVDRRAGHARRWSRTAAPAASSGSRAASAQSARAEREVILSAGALQSPQLLQLSGIGPAALLRRHGIAVAVDAPEVGAQPAGPLPGARHRQAEGEALAQRRRAQSAAPGADGRAVAVLAARAADGRRRPGRRPGRAPSMPRAGAPTCCST